MKLFNNNTDISHKRSWLKEGKQIITPSINKVIKQEQHVWKFRSGLALHFLQIQSF